jgi:hypothetical protein
MTKNISTKFLLLAALFLVTSVGQALAQAGYGIITGVVTDSNGASVPNATFKLTSTERGSELTATASGDGIYTFTNVEPGKYTVTASGGNFAAQTLNVEVQVGRTTDVNFTLGAGGVAAEVTVTAEGVQTTQSNSDAVLSDTAIANLPINGRRFQDFATLTPTAQIDTERNQISLSGQRGVNANINVDGVDYNQPFFGGIRGGERSNFAPTIPQESIKEFQVVAAGYSAEFGRSSGGIVNVVTKGGTNEFRGTAFYLIRPEKFSRNHAFVKRLEVVNNRQITAAPTQQQFGGSFGGPLIKNKLFFFGSYENQKFSADRFIAFSGLDTITRNAANQEAFDYFRSLEQSYELTNDANTLLGRIDWNINSVHNANFRYSWNKSKGLNSVAVGDAGVLFNPVVNAALSNEGTEIDKNSVFVGQVVSTLSSSFVNDFRFQYARGDRPRFANELTPAVSVTNVGFYGTRSFLPTTQYDKRTQFVEGFSVIKGNHNAKFGGEYSNIFMDQLFGFNQFGAYSFSGTGNTPLTVMALDPTQPNDRRFDTGTFYNQQIGNTAATFSIKELAFYGQDSWRVRQNFTLNFGIRLEKQYNPEAELGNDAIINSIRAASFPLLGGRSFDPASLPDSPWQVGPRLGFAWDISGDGKSVLRAFSGMYYARTPGIIIAAPVNNFRIPPGDVSVGLPFATTALSANNAAGVTAYNAFLAANPGYVAIMTATGTPCPAVVNPGDARACVPSTVFRQFATIGINLNTRTLGNLPTLSAAQLTDISGRLGLGISPGSGATFIGMEPEYRNPESFQFGFGYERELAPGFVLGVDYSQVKTSFLQRNLDINLPAPTIAGPVFRPTFNRNNRPVIGINRLVLRLSNGKSLFTAATVRTRLIRKWVHLSAFYTFSRSLSDDDNERNATGLFYENAFNLQSEYYYARLDRRHQFVADPIFFLPWNVQVSSGIRLRSGVPIDAVLGSDINGDSNNSDRPYLAPGVPFQRNSYRNRPEITVDLRAQKTIAFGENRKLVLSTEFFNLFNNANIQYAGTQANFCATTNDPLCGLGGIPTNPNFLHVRDNVTGNILQTNFSRTPVFQMQFGVRLSL